MLILVNSTASRVDIRIRIRDENRKKQSRNEAVSVSLLTCMFVMVGGAAAGLPGLHRARHPQGAPGSQGPGEGCEYLSSHFLNS